MIEVGQKASLIKKISDEDVRMFSVLSLDDNPIHFDSEFAEKSIFGDIIVHGFLYGSLISAVIGTKLPGPGTIYMKQSMKFVRPVFRGDTITAEVEVLEVDRERGTTLLKTTCLNQNSQSVIDGEAIVKLP